MAKLLKSFIRFLRGEVSTKKLVRRGLKVGENFNRQGHCIIDPPHCWLIKIGNNVTLATGVYILAHDASTKNFLGYTKIGNVIIGDNVFVGAYSIILPNVVIGNNVIIGSGSIVTKNIPDNVVVAGNPAKVISTIDEYKNKMKALMNNDNTFENDYTLSGKITKEKKQEMKDKINNKVGFVK